MMGACELGLSPLKVVVLLAPVHHTEKSPMVDAQT